MLHLLDMVGAGLFAMMGAGAIALLLERRTPPCAKPPVERDAVFLFEGESLVDASPAARRLLRTQGHNEVDLTTLLALLARSFGTDLRQRLASLPPAGRLRLASADAGTLEARGNAAALQLTLRLDEKALASFERLSVDAAEAELTLLRGLAENAPQPIWMLDAQGALSWANSAYLALADHVRTLRHDGAKPGAPALIRPNWPKAPLFEVPADLAEGVSDQRRLAIPMPDGRDPLWYEVTSVRRSEGSLHFATDVGGLVLAESARHHLVQTLAKTFAQLRTGLAVFDRERRLALFNPAFVDLTGLPAAFLSERPVVATVLDRLREAKILPEPRDYRSWRENVAALESAAEQGQYCETWTLPAGQTYRVTGRPHPDGALAFLFEDISDEIGLTRRFRTELDMTRAVLDAMDQAIAVFSATGVLSLANSTYEDLWGLSADDLAKADLDSELTRWEAASLPLPLWRRLREGVGAPGRTEGTELTLRRGGGLILRMLPLPRGGTLVTFRPCPPEAREDGAAGSRADAAGPQEMPISPELLISSL
ncbi:PAS domain-containing protein [Rubellimicrobium rubrum]|uniref:PAS domain-containing protein n=1 Tax=Rubellimicrobium rubrum TaxID=2585369 RepID=A0A5C4MQQ4_9RHOB|nr:PAS-domain containing protein [Rubellimicrobium rubrum]TNC48182.1 PAS domain-containing protein [Rubellimicrobium rubrum]